MKIGFIGVGNIGAPIAGQLLRAGHALVVYDVRRAAANRLLEAGASWSDTPAALAAECEIVATCLPGPAEMEEVCLGPGGVVEHLKPGVLYMDHTTNAPALVGGEREVFERARPLFDAIAKRVIYTGGSGTASIAKIMHNSASFTLDLVMAECWTAGVNAGIDARAIVEDFTEAALGNMMSLKVRLP